MSDVIRGQSLLNIGYLLGTDIQEASTMNEISHDDQNVDHLPNS